MDTLTHLLLSSENTRVQTYACTATNWGQDLRPQQLAPNVWMAMGGLVYTSSINNLLTQNKSYIQFWMPENLPLTCLQYELL